MSSIGFRPDTPPLDRRKETEIYQRVEKKFHEQRATARQIAEDQRMKNKRVSSATRRLFSDQQP
ncbi:MAG: hypothetical protein JXA94_01485 [Parachlamydiales bacterium]|nr:hypothetical protein [Parachlamydiales bacterium]